jgi:hypothetical protein
MADPGIGTRGSIDLLTALDLLGKAEDQLAHAADALVRAEARVAELEAERETMLGEFGVYATDPRWTPAERCRAIDQAVNRWAALVVVRPEKP